MKKNKAILFVIATLTNLILVNFFFINIGFVKVLILHSFLFSLSFLSDLIQSKILGKKKIIPFYFFSINFFRIFLCLIFLLPTILQYTPSEKSYIYNFFIAYFVYLFNEIVFMGKKRSN